MDEVTIDNDLNDSIKEPMDKVLSKDTLLKEDYEALYIYYVACTRARFKINNAKWLYNDEGDTDD